ncbi:hypothetical protein SGUI_2617 [Serinicoccus hydrothermalis]|uniref:Class E sortase n=1 Tax=Serinicoccus hydrothermalis TaxID=1758689 RepID=A0A1B1NF28_9MICO|nr:hypothetical protein SGUI_2617 [Serinicoccus hydrothermalis]
MLGELMISAGALVLLFALWQFWWTDVVADAASEDRVAALQESFASGAEFPGSGGPTADAGNETEAEAEGDDGGADGTPGGPDGEGNASDQGRQTWAQGEDLALVHLPTIGELRPVAQA